MGFFHDGADKGAGSFFLAVGGQEDTVSRFDESDPKNDGKAKRIGYGAYDGQSIQNYRQGDGQNDDKENHYAPNHHKIHHPPDGKNHRKADFIIGEYLRV